MSPVAVSTVGEPQTLAPLQPLGTACDVAGLELQGEGITWLPDDAFLLTSEGGFGVPGTLTVVRCERGE